MYKMGSLYPSLRGFMTAIPDTPSLACFLLPLPFLLWQHITTTTALHTSVVIRKMPVVSPRTMTYCLSSLGGVGDAVVSGSEAIVPLVVVVGLVDAGLGVLVRVMISKFLVLLVGLVDTGLGVLDGVVMMGMGTGGRRREVEGEEEEKEEEVAWMIALFTGGTNKIIQYKVHAAAS